MSFAEYIRFEVNAKVIDHPPSLFKEQAFASLSNLTSVFPASIKPEESPDLLFIASPLVRVDFANANGDCLPLVVARDIYKKWTNKLLDIEHNRKNIVGFILNTEFTDSETQAIIKEEDLDSYEGNIDISYAAAVFRLAAPKLSALLVEASDESSPKYGVVSSSLELGLNRYMIAVGKTRNLKEGRIITDPKEAKMYSAYLQCNKGKGVDKDGNFVYRVITGFCLPTGAGLVANPASQVEGVFVLPTDDISETDDTDKAKVVADNKQTIVTAPAPEIKAEVAQVPIEVTANTTENLQENTNNTEIDVITSVNSNNHNPMTFSKIEDIKASLFKEEAVASAVTQFIATEITKASEQYIKELNAQKDSTKKLEEAKASAEQKTVELQTKVQELATQLNKIEEAKAAAQAETDFNNRMSAFDAEYELDEEDRKAIVEDIKACKTNEQFTAFASKMKVLLKEKSKANKKAKAEKLQKEIKAAATVANINLDKVTIDEKTLDFKEIVASVATSVQPNIPNTAPTNEPTLLERMSKAFSGKVTVGNKTTK